MICLYAMIIRFVKLRKKKVLKKYTWNISIYREELDIRENDVKLN